MKASRDWEFHNPTRIIFGLGAMERLPSIVRGRVLLVTTKGELERHGRTILPLLGESPQVFDGVESNPTITGVENAIERLRGGQVDTVVALGGGSALDTAKVLKVAIPNRAFDLQRATEGGWSAQGAVGMPLVALPTTAGTGSEVTPTATVWDAAHRRKRSVAGPDIFPSVAVIDPNLSRDLPWEITLSTGLDALCQCLESVANLNATSITTAIASRGLQLIPWAVRALSDDQRDITARGAMAEAALMSGLAISQTRTALAHSMSYPITSNLDLPHGLACALFTPAVLAFSAEADDGRLARLGSAGTAQSLLSDIDDLFADLGVATAIRRIVGDAPDLQSFAGEMLTPERADNNLRPASPADVRNLAASAERWLAGDPPL